MKEVIYLVANKRKIERMTKTLPNIYRGETVIKLTVNMADSAFDPPVLDQEVIINDWRDGIDLEDVEFKQNIITKEEAEIIKQRRLERMKEVLENQGYTVSKEEE